MRLDLEFLRPFSLLDILRYSPGAASAKRLLSCFQMLDKRSHSAIIWNISNWSRYTSSSSELYCLPLDKCCALTIIGNYCIGIHRSRNRLWLSCKGLFVWQMASDGHTPSRLLFMSTLGSLSILIFDLCRFLHPFSPFFATNPMILEFAVAASIDQRNF